MALDGYKLFLKQFQEQFHTTGALAPSSRMLARAITAPFRHRRKGKPVRALEVGPGTGSFTDHLAADLRPGDQLTLIEANSEFVRFLTERLTGQAAGQVRIVEGYVPGDLPEGPYDFIVSGLPLNNFEPPLVKEILDALIGALADGGVLSYFEYIAVRDVKRLFVSEEERQRLDAIAEVTAAYIRRHQFRENRVYVNIPPAVARHLRK
jgi:phosphatidylethanolamine/phosphatidyl-N-methylethanolamine N-methyltransferase